ncbi:MULTISPECIES: 3-oxoacyl-[acyl-carrier-protein] synthase III C-terminal domain-containing protein [Rhodomicrobium]|uniref:type III polyketide synthase n=1 Tax=Rhodomicrobium TaxID=1068 RepID=UPI000B4B7490|nr:MULTISPECIES: 3-oxoacyl-[acyl-carrier-protein] synthase III C-terminal domain-containing protein [Rhodomicrobium]
MPVELRREPRSASAGLDVGIVSLATAVPTHAADQRQVVDAARDVFRDQFEEFDRIAAVFFTAGIENRFTVKPFPWYLEEQDWPSRTAAYVDGATALFIQSAAKALDAAGMGASQVDTIVTVSSTGIAAPSLEARAMAELGFRADVLRVPVFGLGCAGGAAGLALGAELAAARPGSVVLVVAVELCSLAVRRDLATKANLVALALFGDGAAAVVLKSGAQGRARITGARAHTWPDTLDIMGWRVDPTGFGVIFDQSIPRFAYDNLAGAVDGILAAQGLARPDIARFICHPGGRKVVEAIEASLTLRHQSLDHEREVLKRYGNMSAPTVLFVLEQALAAGPLPERALLMALGPGFTLSTVTLAAPSA